MPSHAIRMLVLLAGIAATFARSEPATPRAPTVATAPSPSSAASVKPGAPARMREFHADLAAEWQTRYTESPATGRAEFQLDLATLTLSWTLSFQDLSGPPRTMALHAPAQPGANGAKILDLAARGGKSPARGSAVISAAQVQYLLYGWSYVNLTTAKFPAGEIRGQLDVRPPPPPPITLTRP